MSVFPLNASIHLNDSPCIENELISKGNQTSIDDINIFTRDTHDNLIQSHVYTLTVKV